MKANELLFKSCCYAEEHLFSLLDAMGDSDPSFTEQLERELTAIRDYRLKRWGKSRFEVVIDNCVEVDVMSLIGKPKIQV